MKFEDFENMWAAQRPTHAPAAEPAELMRAVISELRRRSRMLGYDIFGVLVGLIIIPVLTIANRRYAPPPDEMWHWIQVVTVMIFVFASLVYTFRRIRRHRALLRQRADTLRSITIVSLANVEAEMQEYRLMRSPFAWLCYVIVAGIPLVSGTVQFGWKSYGLPAGLMIFGLLSLMSFVFRRHYRVNLEPEYARQKEILKQLS